MTKSSIDYNQIAQNSLLIVTVALFINYLTGYILASDGFSSLETAIFSMSTGITFGIIIFIVHLNFSVKYIKQRIQSNIDTPNIFILWLLSSITIITMYLTFDWLIFKLIDNTISESYGTGLLNMIKNSSNSQEQINSIEEFKLMPNFIQNFFSNVFFIISSIILVLFISKKVATPKKHDYMM